MRSEESLPTGAMLDAEPALGPVLRDLAAQPVAELVVRGTADPACVLVLEASSGALTGIPYQDAAVRAAEPAPDAIVRVADAVQDAAVTALWAASRSPVWPGCPRHPGTHPLRAAVIDDRAVWRCPAEDVEITGIGALPHR